MSAIITLMGLPRCTVAMEACCGAPFWGREIGKPGHEVRLIPPGCVKPVVGRQKDDGEEDRGPGGAATADDRCRGHLRGVEPVARRSIDPVDRWKVTNQQPNMRFVSVKGEEKQGAAAVFRVRELPIRQRTQTVNALRGHLTDFREAAPQGAASMRGLIALIEKPDSDLPETARATLQVLVDGLRHLDARIGGLDAEIARRARDVGRERTRRRMAQQSEDGWGDPECNKVPSSTRH